MTLTEPRLDEIPVGSKIRLTGPASDQDWTVRAHVGTRYLIATRQAPSATKGELQYTVLDFDEQIRGSLNVVGYGYPCTTDAEIAAMAAELAAGEWEISHRNNVPLQVERVARG